jgi:glycerol-3-phosphate dehydrogenase
MSQQSRNRYVGEQLGKGRSIDEITAEMHQVAEALEGREMADDVVVDTQASHDAPLRERAKFAHPG